jgi:hypothetical protein
MTVVFDGNGRYVLGYGSALGTESAPGPGLLSVAFAVVVVSGFAGSGPVLT